MSEVRAVSPRIYQRISDYIIRMAKRAKIAIGITLLIAGLAVIGRPTLWIGTAMLLLAVFFVYWAMEQRATEAFVESLPMGRHLKNMLVYIEAALVARDPDYAQHIRSTVVGYDAELRTALRTLYRTRNTNLVGQHEQRFKADGLIEYPKDGPGWIKPEARDIVGRTLDEIGA